MLTAPSDKQLRGLLAFSKHDDVELLPHVAVSMARELLAARKVVRAADKLMRCNSFESDEWFGREAGLMAEIGAYDKARKGGG